MIAIIACVNIIIERIDTIFSSYSKKYMYLCDMKTINQ